MATGYCVFVQLSISFAHPQSTISVGLTWHHAPCSSGDLGSPLLCNNTHLVGLASYTKFGSGARTPYVYSDVHKFKGWIESRGKGKSRVEMCDDDDCKDEELICDASDNGQCIPRE